MTRETWVILICQCGFPLGGTRAVLRLKNCPDCGRHLLPLEDCTRRVTVYAEGGPV